MVYRKKKAAEPIPQIEQIPTTGLVTRVTEHPHYWKGFKSIDEHNTWKKNSEKFSKAREREKCELADTIFRYNGKLYSSFDMMDHIVMQTYEGYELPDILSDDSDETNELPTAKEVHMWLDKQPTFKLQMDHASKYKAEMYNSMAIKAVTHAGYGQLGGPTRDQVAYAKLVSETFNRQAALNNDKFQEKTKHEVEDITHKMSEEQLKAKLAELMKDPHIKQTVIDAIGTTNVLNWIGQAEPIDVNCEEENNEIREP
jgi:hypothetical protein